MNLIISRSGFCNHCFSSGRPEKENLFVTFGTSHQTFSIHQCEHEVPNSKKGYVPLLFEKFGVEQLASGLFVKYRKTCGIVGCGIDMTTIDDKKRDLITYVERIDNGVKYKVYFYRHRWTSGMMPANDWNALVRDFKNTGYELDE